MQYISFVIICVLIIISSTIRRTFLAFLFTSRIISWYHVSYFRLFYNILALTIIFLDIFINSLVYNIKLSNIQQRTIWMKQNYHINFGKERANKYLKSV